VHKKQHIQFVPTCTYWKPMDTISPFILCRSPRWTFCECSYMHCQLTREATVMGTELHQWCCHKVSATS